MGTAMKFLERLMWWPMFFLECAVPLLYIVPEFFRILFPKKCKDVRGQLALVTGAGQGIGREVALELARKGCDVICVDIQREQNENTVQQIVKLGQKSSSYICDVTDRNAVMNLADKVGPVDILVNNAGFVFFDPLLQTPPEIVKKLIDLNVTSHVWMLQAFIPGMLSRNQGHVVTMASCSAFEGLPNAAIYSASKSAVLGLMKTYSEEIKINYSSNIKISCVCPYFVKTVAEVDRIDAKIPPMEVSEAARMIVEGIRRELEVFTVPSYMYLLTTLKSLLPHKVQHMLKNTMNVTMASRKTC